MAFLIQMLQQALSSAPVTISNETKRILLKEVFQAYILDFLYNHPRYKNLNFYGGTCLHVVYQLDRLSEDIDLDNMHDVPLSSLEEDLSNALGLSLTYKDLSVKKQMGTKGILRFLVKFPVLQELGLSSFPDENLHIKLEISTHQQTAEIQQTPLVFHGRSFVPSHFTLETMMAGKMLACLEREFRVGRSHVMIKGRDFYDLVWFMQRKIYPLEKKLASDGKVEYTSSSAFQALKEKIENITPKQLADDLNPLFQSRVYIDSWINTFHEKSLEYLDFYL
jgi:predicted nucleotidyltransferase component of viral defense system